MLLRIICKLGGDEVICTAGEDLRARLRLAIPQSAFRRDDLPRWRVLANFERRRPISARIAVGCLHSPTSCGRCFLRG